MQKQTNKRNKQTKKQKTNLLLIVQPKTLKDVSNDVLKDVVTTFKKNTFCDVLLSFNVVSF